MCHAVSSGTMEGGCTLCNKLGLSSPHAHIAPLTLVSHKNVHKENRCHQHAGVINTVDIVSSIPPSGGGMKGGGGVENSENCLQMGDGKFPV